MMAEPTKTRLSRRDFFQGAALLALALGIPIAGVRLSHLEQEDVLSDRQRQLLREISQLVIPRTDTPGAGDVGVGDFVILALAHGLEGSRGPGGSAPTPQFARFRRRDGSLRHVYWLEHELDRRGEGDFLALQAGERSTTLAALDGEAYSHGQDAHPWRTVKALVLTGYYTSEIGGALELRYELVPGRYDPDVLVGPDSRAFSSDWTAVDFG